MPMPIFPSSIVVQYRFSPSDVAITCWIRACWLPAAAANSPFALSASVRASAHSGERNARLTWTPSCRGRDRTLTLPGSPNPSVREQLRLRHVGVVGEEPERAAIAEDLDGVEAGVRWEEEHVLPLEPQE